MRDISCLRVFGADACDAAVGGFACFAEGIVAGVEVFAFFELVLEEIFLVGKFAIEAEETLLVGGEGLGCGVSVCADASERESSR